MAIKFSQDVEKTLAEVAKQEGLDLRLLRTLVQIESSGNPKAVSVSGYKGLFQLSDAGFHAHGGKGSIFDPRENARAASKHIKMTIAHFTKRNGRQPMHAELYLAHQQGVSGASAHLANPNQAAWQSMHSTLEGRKRGVDWSKKAIWNNLPEQEKKRHRKVDNVTSKQFADFWLNKFNRVYAEV